MQEWLRSSGMLGFPGMGMGGSGGSAFNTRLCAFSAPFMERADPAKINDVNYGGKAMFPTSVLDHLMRLNIQYPMLFKLTNTSADSQRATHCGVLEFSAEEGRCYLPGWTMRQLNLEEGQEIRVESCSLPKATYAKLKPQNLDFLHITNPKAMLEVELRKFACLSKNDRISVLYNDQILEFLVQELKPKNAVCIIECDVNLEFDAPEGYVEHTPEARTCGTAIKPAAPTQPIQAPPTTGFSAFGGSGVRLDGKSHNSSASLQEQSTPTEIPPAFCVADYKPGKLNFIRYDYKCREVQEKELKEKCEAIKTNANAFSGAGSTIRRARY